MAGIPGSTQLGSSPPFLCRRLGACYLRSTGWLNAAERHFAWRLGQPRRGQTHLTTLCSGFAAPLHSIPTPPSSAKERNAKFLSHSRILVDGAGDERTRSCPEFDNQYSTTHAV